MDSVGLHLQGLLASSSSPTESLTRLRGAQAALFRAGWLVTFRPEAFGVSDMGSLLLRPGLGPGATTRLRRLCSPQSAAVMALFLVADLSSHAMSRLSLANVADDGGEVTVDLDRFSVPEYGEGLLRAQLIHRRREGSAPEDPLFQPAVADARRATILLDDLRFSGNRTAISVGTSDLRDVGGGGATWLRTRHVRVTRLAGLRRGASL